MGDQAVLTPRLTLISDIRRLGEEAFFRLASTALHAGVDALLLRELQMDDARLLAIAARLRILTRQCSARLIVHTRINIAKAVDADGVHLSADFLRSGATDMVFKSGGMSLSASCHNLDELKAAERLGMDFVFLSPVFKTASHPEANPIGPERFHALRLQTSVPVVALGGITPGNRSLLADAPVAVMRAVYDAEDVEEAVCRLLLTHSPT